MTDIPFAGGTVSANIPAAGSAGVAQGLSGGASDTSANVQSFANTANSGNLSFAGGTVPVNNASNFDGAKYLSVYSDVRNAGVSPQDAYQHYINFGQSEGRTPYWIGATQPTTVADGTVPGAPTTGTTGTTTTTTGAPTTVPPAYTPMNYNYSPYQSMFSRLLQMGAFGGGSGGYGLWGNTGGFGGYGRSNGYGMPQYSQASSNMPLSYQLPFRTYFNPFGGY